jgi:hypothetical protein
MPREFDPPYDSPIEQDFAWGLSKHLAETTILHKQVEVPTSAATFRLDLVAQTDWTPFYKPPGSGFRIAFECDGKDYHADVLRDECRDALILSTNAVSAIYRFRGCDLHYHLADCLFYILTHDPFLFSDRGRRNIEVLASDASRLKVTRREYGAQALFYGDDLSDMTYSFFQRRSLRDGQSTKREQFVVFAGKYPAESFDRLVERFGNGER